MTDPGPMTVDVSGGDVVAVTVTYGDRREMLLTVINAVKQEGVARIVVVDNGAHWPVASELAQRFAGFVHVVSMGGNKGSAAGYVTGLETTMAMGNPFVWLLDDDNCPRSGCLATLRDALREEELQTPMDRLAVVALRPEHLVGGVSARQLMTRWDSFGGFHVADLMGKLVNRLPLRPGKALTTRVALGIAPYGGLLFNRSLIERLGLPRLEFGQYGDDTEFTWRITSSGGRIVLVTDAIVDDLEEAFQKNTLLRNRFLGALMTENSLRTYYTFRNLAYFESRFRHRNRLMFKLNRWVYFAILRHYAGKLGYMDRYRLIRESSDKGLKGDLDPGTRFSLH